MAKTKESVSKPVAKAPLPYRVPESQDNFTGGRPIPGTGGFTAPSMDVKYTVERTVPPDGLLGTHYGRFSVEELGKEYGEGTYKILKYEPGRTMPIEFIQKVAPSFGQPRFPRSVTGSTSAVPTKMVERSIMNRLAECRQLLDSVTTKMKQKKIDPGVIRGETDFLLYSIKDVGALLFKLSTNGHK